MAMTRAELVCVVAMLLAGSAVPGCGTNDGAAVGGSDTAEVAVSTPDAADTNATPDGSTLGKDAAADAKLDSADAGPVYPPCTCGADDDCDACFARIGECCYEDPTMGGQAGLIARNCDFNPSCKPCCSECAARSCEEIKALGGCPAL